MLDSEFQNAVQLHDAVVLRSKNKPDGTDGGVSINIKHAASHCLGWESEG